MHRSLQKWGKVSNLNMLILNYFFFSYQQMKEFPFFLLLFCCCYCYSIAFLVRHMRSLTEWKLLSILDAQVPYMTLFSLNACLGLKWYSEPWFNFLPMSEIGSSCTLFAQWVNKVGKSRSEKEISSEKKKKRAFQVYPSVSKLQSCIIAFVVLSVCPGTGLLTH